VAIVLPRVTHPTSAPNRRKPKWIKHRNNTSKAPPQQCSPPSSSKSPPQGFAPGFSPYLPSLVIAFSIYPFFPSPFSQHTAYIYAAYRPYIVFTSWVPFSQHTAYYFRGIPPLHRLFTSWVPFSQHTAFISRSIPLSFLFPQPCSTCHLATWHYSCPECHTQVHPKR
jgi:hypothetical protein